MLNCRQCFKCTTKNKKPLYYYKALITASSFFTFSFWDRAFKCCASFHNVFNYCETIHSTHVKYGAGRFTDSTWRNHCYTRSRDTSSSIDSRVIDLSKPPASGKGVSPTFSVIGGEISLEVIRSTQTSLDGGRCFERDRWLEHRLRSRQTHHVGKNVRIRAHRR